MSSEGRSDPQMEIGHVLAMDVVGYSKLLIREQTELLRRLGEIVRSTAQVGAAEAEGNLIRLPTGDGMTLVFLSDPKAPIECATEIAAALKSDPDIPLRMGIHSGPINRVLDVNEQANAAGAGIDLAQRVMDCGDTGHILVSRRAADDLAPYARWNPHLHQLGECEVKHGRKIGLVNFYTDEVGNAAVPQKCRRDAQLAGGATPPRSILRTFLFIAALLGLLLGAVLFLRWNRSDRTPTPARENRHLTVSQPNEKSIAVLPFENLSDDKQNAYFADGVQNEILTKLAGVGDLKVIARTSTLKYKSRPADPAVVGRELNVSKLLEGAVQRGGDQVRINVQLIDAATSTNIWGESYDREVKNIFAVETEVAEKVARALQAKLTPVQQERLNRNPTENLAAYEDYLRGRDALLSDYTQANLNAALQFFEKATRADPNFALAWANLAQVNLNIYWQFVDRSPARLQLARDALDRAVRLDPGLPAAHVTAGYFLYWIERDYVGALREFELARSATPNDVDLYVGIASVERRQGHWEAAQRNYEKGIELDPRRSFCAVALADTQLIRRRFEDAEERRRRMVELWPELTEPNRLQLWLALNWKGDQNAARAALEEGIARAGTRDLFPLGDFQYWWIPRCLGGDPATLEKELTPILFVDPDVTYHLAVGQLEQYTGNLEGARVHYNQVATVLEQRTSQNPNEALYHSQLGVAYAGLGRSADAVREGEQAVAMMPTSRDVLWGRVYLQNLALIQAMTGNKTAAIDGLQKVLRAAGPTTAAWLRIDPAWANLRGEARFESLLKEPDVIDPTAVPAER